MSELPASLQEAIRRAVLKAYRDALSAWSEIEAADLITEALLPVFEAHVKAAEEAGFAEGCNWVEDGKSNDGTGALARHDNQVRDKALEEAEGAFQDAYSDCDDPLIGVMWGMKAIKNLKTGASS